MKRLFEKYEFFVVYFLFMSLFSLLIVYHVYFHDKTFEDILFKDSSLVAFLISLHGALFWGILLFQLDKFKKEPFDVYFFHLVVPAVFLSYFVGFFLDFQMEKLFGKESAFLAVGFIEEGVKMFAVLLFVYKSKYFDEPMDGLFYGGMAAISFSFCENFFYNMEIMNTSYALKDEYLYLFGRFVSTFVHIVVSAVWGYELGKYKLGMTTKNRVALAFLFAALFHSLYDLALYYEKEYISFIIMIFLILFFLFSISYFNRISPYNRSYLFECESCHYHVRENSNICPRCKKVFVKVTNRHQLYCSRCNNRVSRSQKVCESCGFELKK